MGVCEYYETEYKFRIADLLDVQVTSQARGLGEGRSLLRVLRSHRYAYFVALILHRTCRSVLLGLSRPPIDHYKLQL